MGRRRAEDSELAGSAQTSAAEGECAHRAAVLVDQSDSTINSEPHGR